MCLDPAIDEFAKYPPLDELLGRRIETPYPIKNCLYMETRRLKLREYAASRPTVRLYIQKMLICVILCLLFAE